ncbi:MAG: S8 family serine peptidase [Mycobacteriales bacterium]
MTLSRRTSLLAGLLSLAVAVTPALAAGPPAAGPERPSGSYDGTRLLVAFDPGTPGAAREHAHRAEGARVENTMPRLNLDVVKLPDGADAVEVAARYEGNPNVAYTDFNHRFSIETDDTLFPDQWGLHNTGQPVTGSLVKGVADVDIDAPEGWDLAFGVGLLETTGGTLTGVLDTGIDRTHIDLLDRTKVCATANSGTGIIVEGTCSDDNLHGTHVAGTIAAHTANGIGVAGVAPNAPLAIFKGLDAAGVGFYADIVAGVDYLSTHKAGVRIISMSIGGPEDDALNKVLSDAYARGTLLVAAAGNDGDSTPSWPAYHRDVLSVSSIDADGKRSSFSTCNSDVEIAAPGRHIWSTFPGNTYGSISGTSMATPHVSGVAAMLIWKKALSASQARSALVNTAQGSGNCNNVGIVNLGSAMGGGSGGTSDPEPVGSGSIAGTVTSGNGKNRSPVSGATVDCGPGGSATTAGDGTYAIGSVPVGSYTCTASAPGLKPKSQNVSVSDGQTTTADFTLR